jgi:hypothetical protein
MKIRVCVSLVLLYLFIVVHTYNYIRLTFNVFILPMVREWRLFHWWAFNALTSYTFQFRKTSLDLPSFKHLHKSISIFSIRHFSLASIWCLLEQLHRRSLLFLSLRIYLLLLSIGSAFTRGTLGRWFRLSATTYWETASTPYRSLLIELWFLASSFSTSIISLSSICFLDFFFLYRIESPNAMDTISLN